MWRCNIFDKYRARRAGFGSNAGRGLLACARGHRSRSVSLLVPLLPRNFSDALATSVRFTRGAKTVNVVHFCCSGIYGCVPSPCCHSRHCVIAACSQIRFGRLHAHVADQQMDLLEFSDRLVNGTERGCFHRQLLSATRANGFGNPVKYGTVLM